jgi:cytochrome c554/c'-like protein
MLVRVTLALTLVWTAPAAIVPNHDLSGSPTEAPTSDPLPKAKAERHDYVGDNACRLCHRQKVETFHNTAHYLTSRLPDRTSILGSFSPGANVLETSNPALFFRMEATEKSFFQTAVEGRPPGEFSHTERFDFVIGSGNKGQTYLYWKGTRLFELPVSYWTDLGWVNSPGYVDGIPDFSRSIVPRCLECHATYFEAIPPVRNRYDTANFVLGITCEKCHGPGRRHMLLYSSKSAADSSRGLQSPAIWPRERQIDLCAWCHAGAGKSILPAFSYVPGRPLTKYVELPPLAPGAQVDVHGSQVELLEKSRCFQSSTMTCTTCHNVHTPQHDLVAFSKRCLSCHAPASCGRFATLGDTIAQNCIDCHMPRQETNLILFDRKGPKARPRMRNHWIKVYADAATP